MRSVFCLTAVLLLTSCVTTTEPMPESWLSVPEAPRLRSLTLDHEGKVTHPRPVVPLRQGEIAIESGPEGQRLVSGGGALTEWFQAIDSFDVSAARGEVVFSAKRERDFDIGLVSTEGSHVNWFPSDPGDEVAVQWAPRGNKASYVIRSPGGDVVRTLHVPTSAALTVDFAGAAIHAVAWDPQAEHIAVAYSTLLSSDQIDVVRYGGEDHRTVVTPAERVDAASEPVGRGATLLRPHDLRYGEKLPLVFWLVGEPGWNDARAALMRRARVAVVVAESLEAVLWEAVAGIPWLDASRSFVVTSGREVHRQAFVVRGDASVPAGRVRLSEKVVAVSPTVVQSFSAGFIAEELKRTTSPNATSP